MTNLVGRTYFYDCHRANFIAIAASSAHFYDVAFLALRYA